MQTGVVMKSNIIICKSKTTEKHKTNKVEGGQSRSMMNKTLCNSAKQVTTWLITTVIHNLSSCEIKA